jgi:hypothetical protein
MHLIPVFRAVLLVCFVVMLTVEHVQSRKNRRTRRVGPPTVPFNRNNFDSRFFLSSLPSDSLLSQSYPIRETLSSALQKHSSSSEQQMVTTEAEFHLVGSNLSSGLIQMRQVVRK